jgi:hypothetical protein
MSVGAINAAIIAGSPSNSRIDRLRELWSIEIEDEHYWDGKLVSKYARVMKRR